MRERTFRACLARPIHVAVLPGGGGQGRAWNARRRTHFAVTLLPPPLQVVPSKEVLLEAFQEEVAGKDEPALRRLINESEEIADQREALKKKLTLLQKAQKEIAAFV